MTQVLFNPFNGTVRTVEDGRALVLKARGWTEATDEQIAAATATGWRGEGVGTAEPVVPGLSGAPAADAPRTDWDLYARQHGIDPSAYEDQEELIEAVQNASAAGEGTVAESTTIVGTAASPDSGPDPAAIDAKASAEAAEGNGSEEELKGEALDARAAELEIEGRSSMSADEKRKAIAAAEAEQAEPSSSSDEE